VLIQLLSIVGTACYSAVATTVVLLVTRLLTGGLRVDAESEIKGLDGSVHGERGFEIT
jgi:Amt family ammonium transporter